MLMAITYGKGRIFHTAMGHGDEGGGPAMQCTGFIVTLQRGAEWAATGNVTQAVPFDFPTAAGVVLRPDFKEITLEEAFANIGNYDIGKSTKIPYLSAVTYRKLPEMRLSAKARKEMVKCLIIMMHPLKVKNLFFVNSAGWVLIILYLFLLY